MSFVHPDDHEATEAEYASVIGGSESLAFENRWRHRDGSYRWLQWATTTDHDVELIYAAARDIIDAKRAEMELRSLLAEQAALRRVATLVARGGRTRRGRRRRRRGGRQAALRRGRRRGAIRVSGARDRGRNVEQGRCSPGACGRGGGARRRHRRCPGVRDGQARAQHRLRGPRGGRSPRDSTSSGTDRAWPRPSTSKAVCGGRLRLPTSVRNRWPRAPSSAWRAFPSWSPRRSRTPMRVSSSPRRARLVEASDSERRRLERNLHDGAQQRLQAVSLTLRVAQARVAGDPNEAHGLLNTARRSSPPGSRSCASSHAGFTPRCSRRRGSQLRSKASSGALPFRSR